MNIPKLNDHIKVNDILQKCRLLSLAFNNYNDDVEYLKKFGIFHYKNCCEKFIEFPEDRNDLWFHVTPKYQDLLYDTMKDPAQCLLRIEEDSFINSFSNFHSSMQIFIGRYDDKYVFLDMQNDLLLFVGDEFLETYVNMLLLKTDHTLFDNDFIEIKNKIMSLDFTLYECLIVERKMRSQEDSKLR